MPKSGTINVALIPIDWADLPGESDWDKRVQDQIVIFNEYWKTVSGNKLKFNWTIQNNWIRLPGISRDYSVPYSEAHPETEKLFEKIVPVVDTKFDFSKIDIRIGEIIAAEKMEKSKKLLKLTVNDGIKDRTILSGIAEHFKPEEVVGKQVSFLANLAPRKMMGLESEGMILMAEDADGSISFVQPDKKIWNGATVN